MKSLATLALCSVFALPAGAATFSVSSTADAWDANPGDGICDDGTGHCPLRAAIMEANVSGSHDTLVLNGVTHYLSPAFSGTGENAAKLGDLDIKRDLSITTRYGAVATIDAGGIGDRVFHVLDGASVSMTGVRIQNGRETEGYGGGGVRNDGVLTMTRVQVVGNGTDGPGGGIYNGEGATLTFTDGAIRDNFVSVSSWFRGGGGLHVSGSGTVFVDFSTVSGNKADSGGGIAAVGDGSTIVINNTTVSGNTSRGEWGLDGGGGIWVGSYGVPKTAMQLTNVTVSGNETVRLGGGIHNADAQLGLIHVTVTDNRVAGSLGYNGSGLYNGSKPWSEAPHEEAGVWLVSTIIADNEGDENEKQCAGYVEKIFSLGHNIDGDDTCNLTGPGDQPGLASVLLGPLASNGGPTLTHELLSGSPAIDAGEGSWCPTIDQRKHPRPSGAACDVGAYEAGYKVSLAGKTFDVGGVSRRDGSRFSGCMEFEEGGEFTLDGFGSGTWQEKAVDERTVRFEASAADGRSVGFALSGTAASDGRIDAMGYDSGGVEYEVVGFGNPECRAATQTRTAR